MMDKYDEALKAYEEAIRLNPKYGEAWMDKSHVLNALGRTTEADASSAKAYEIWDEGGE